MARKPSKKVDAAAELAEKLLRVLRSQRGLGAGSYPLPVRRLVELTDPSVPAALVKKALNKRDFLRQAVPARAKTPDAPVALAADLDVLAGCPLLLEFLLHQARSPKTQAFSVAALKKKATGKLQKPFQDAVNGQVARGALPPTVAYISIKGSRLLFLLSDLSGGQGPGVRSPESGVRSPEVAAPVKAVAAAAPADFPAAFQQAFDVLDRQGGGHNFVSLIALREALPVGREPFDRGLRELRQAGAYTLSAAEGRDGISPEEREAGIAEEGSLLLFVSRNRP
jgi:hypothetical protein